MKNAILTLVGALALFSGPVFADELEATVNPDAQGAAYTCDMRGAISGIKLGFFIDGQILGGDAVIHCKDATNSGLRDVSMPVRVRVIGGGVGFDFTIVQRANIISDGIGAVRSPRDLVGQYDVAASAGITLINRGYNVQSAISVKRRGNGVAFEVGFQGEKAIGLGARLNGLVLVVEPR